MTKPAIKVDDPLIKKIRKILKSTQPRKLPTETMVNEVIINGSVWARRVGWKCPYCGGYCRRDDRTVRRRYGQETIIDYSGYNMHFAHTHGEPLWKEEQIAKLIRNEVRRASGKIAT
jgi:hypothetical protein